MGRLIDADAIEHCLVIGGRRHGKTIISEIIRRAIQTAPTVDAVPVIRCKDCKHWLPHTQFGYDADYEIYHNYCKRHLPDDNFYAFIKEADDFCSWAERKGE